MPGNAAIPAADSRRKALAHMAGRRIVEMVGENLQPSDILTPEAFQNAVRVNGAIGGSTNAVIPCLHWLAGSALSTLWTIGKPWGRDVPCLVNLMPSGEYLMEDFYYAGGLPAVMRQLAESNLLNKEALTVNGKTQGENVQRADVYGDDVIYSMQKPFKQAGGINVLRGNLAPDGAVLKPSAATPELMQHTGRAVVFEDIDDYKLRIDSDDLDVDASCILVLKNCGPRGYPGMAEVGNMALPAKVLKTGVTDMVRISDARMSGTAYGTVVLHVCPEAALGGPLALVENGDMISLDVNTGSLTLQVDDDVLLVRRSKWKPTHPQATRGYVKMYQETVMQANKGADLEFLRGGSGAPVSQGQPLISTHGTVSGLKGVSVECQL